MTLTRTELGRFGSGVATEARVRGEPAEVVWRTLDVDGMDDILSEGR